MLTERKWMWLRLAVWVVLIVYLATMLSKPELGDAVAGAAADAMGLRPEAPPTWTPLERPAELPPSTADRAGEAAAVFAVLGELDRACVLTGLQIRVEVGERGLIAASTLGPAPACAARVVWGARWPSLAVPLELEVSLP